MSHGLLEQDNMIYSEAGGKPWHKLGTVIPEGDILTPTQALVLARADWEAIKVPVTGNYLSPIEKNEKGQFLKREKQSVHMEGQYMVGKRYPDGTVDPQAIGTSLISKSYTFVQNLDAFKFFEPFIDSGEYAIDTAGTLFGGEIVWVMAKKINTGMLMVGDDDPICEYVLLANGHTGKKQLQVGFTPIRVVCNNTLGLAETNEFSRLVQLRHSKNIHDNLGILQHSMQLAEQSFSLTLEQYNLLVKQDCSREQLERYVDLVFDKSPKHKKSATFLEDYKTKRKEITNHETDGRSLKGKIIQTFEGQGFIGETNSTKNKSMYRAYQAVTQYLTHESAKGDPGNLVSMERRMAHTMLGSSAIVTPTSALKIAMQMAI